MSEKKVTFRVIGIITSTEFQKCRAYVDRLYKSYHKIYNKPDVRPMLDVEWTACITKLRRKVGGSIWYLQRNVVVFINGEYLGDDDALEAYVVERYFISLVKDFEKLGRLHLIQYITDFANSGHNFAYLTFSIDSKVIGSMLFKLCHEMVPITCDNFLKRCNKRRRSYRGTPVQRIVKGSWIQCGGWSLPHHRMPCENYTIPHDRRGVLSMCHGGKHQNNSTQFMISLSPTPWMERKYVAFGHLIQGENVLQQIERVDAYYEKPLRKIEIVRSGEFTLYPGPDLKALDEIKELFKHEDVRTNLHDDTRDVRDKESTLFRHRYKRGKYFEIMDLQSHLPFLHLPAYLLSLPEPEEEPDNYPMKGPASDLSIEEEYPDDYAYYDYLFGDVRDPNDIIDAEPKEPILSYISKLYDDDAEEQA